MFAITRRKEPLDQARSECHGTTPLSCAKPRARLALTREESRPMLQFGEQAGEQLLTQRPPPQGPALGDPLTGISKTLSDSRHCSGWAGGWRGVASRWAARPGCDWHGTPGPFLPPGCSPALPDMGSTRCPEELHASQWGRCRAQPAQAQEHGLWQPLPLVFHSHHHRTLAASTMPASEF